MTPAAPISAEERTALLVIYSRSRELRRRYTFEQVLANGTMLGCLRNILDAKRRRMRAEIPSAAEFQLT